MSESNEGESSKEVPQGEGYEADQDNSESGLFDDFKFPHNIKPR